MFSPQQAGGNPAFQQQQQYAGQLQPQPQPAPLNPQWSGQSQGYPQPAPVNQSPSAYTNPYDQKLPFPPQPQPQGSPPNLQFQQPNVNPQFQHPQFQQQQVHPQFQQQPPQQQFQSRGFSPQNTGFQQHQPFQHVPQPPATLGAPPVQHYHPQGNPAFMQNAAPQAGQVHQIQNFAGPTPGSQYGRHKIIVGLDFGTTYSGLAFADTTPGEPNISIIQNWPNCGTRALSQVPTEIAYPDGGGMNFSWGYDIQPSWTILKWFKLFLEYPDEEVRELCDLPPGKSIEDVTADFLRAVYQHARAQLILQRGKAVMDITQIDFVLTIPAVWNEQACARTKKAAERAGFATNHTLNLCTEPEAAALYTLRSSETSANVGDKIIVCDAGGGTVDLISYNIRRVHPRLEVDEAVVGSGDTCGSTYIDQAFEEFFKARMGVHYDLRVAQLQRVMRNFEEVKCGFRDRDDQETYSVIVPGKNNIPEARVVDGEFEITRQEMRELFDPVINKTIELIADQVRQIAAVDQSPSNRQILLVGGFGQSPYLYKRVVEWAKPQGINVLQPKDGDVAVVKGAVIRGIDLAAPQTVNGVNDPTRAMWIRKCRKHYGTLMIAHFVPGLHAEEDAFIDPLTGLKMARNQISWFVYKGAEISDDKKISQQFHRTFRKTTPWVDTIVVCEDDFPPTRMTPRVKILCTLTADLTNQSKRIFDVEYGFMKKIFTCAYRVDMTLRAGYMTFELVYKGISYGAISVELQ